MLITYAFATKNLIDIHTSMHLKGNRYISAIKLSLVYNFRSDKGKT